MPIKNFPENHPISIKCKFFCYKNHVSSFLFKKKYDSVVYKKKEDKKNHSLQHTDHCSYYYDQFCMYKRPLDCVVVARVFQI